MSKSYFKLNKIIFLIFVILLSIEIAGALNETSQKIIQFKGNYCGNDICEIEENVENCPQDCLDKKVFASYLLWWPPSRREFYEFDKPEYEYIYQDKPLTLSSVYACCNTTTEREGGLCGECHYWTSERIIEDYKKENPQKIIGVLQEMINFWKEKEI